MSFYACIVEPSAGNGSFSKQIPNCIALDIEPEDDSIIKGDFFSYVAPQIYPILVVGNPPFGEQSSLAIKFFNYAATFADTIAFVLPKSFRKVSIQNKLDLNFWLDKEVELPENSFLLGGENYNVPCAFQVWKKREEKRKRIDFPKESKYFSFIKTKEEADFRIQRVGGNAGKAYLDKNGAISSNYYLTNISSFSTKELVEKLNEVKYLSLEDTVGPKSLPKGELIYYSNLVLEDNNES